MIRLEPVNVDLTIAEMEAVLYRNLYDSLLTAYDWKDVYNSWDQEESLEILRRMQEADGPITVKDESVQRNSHDYYYYNVYKRVFNYNRNKKNIDVQEKGIRTLTVVVSLDKDNEDFPITYSFYRPKEKVPFYDFTVSWGEFQEVGAIRD